MPITTYKCDKCGAENLDYSKVKFVRIELRDTEDASPVPKMKVQLLCAKCYNTRKTDEGM